MIIQKLFMCKECNNITSIDPCQEITLEQAKMLKWGTYGKQGTDPLKYIRLGYATTDHLQNILKQPHISDKYRKGIQLILDERKKYNDIKSIKKVINKYSNYEKTS